MCGAVRGGGAAEGGVRGQQKPNQPLKQKLKKKSPLSGVASSSEPAAKNKNSAESGVLAVKIEELRTLNKLQQKENETKQAATNQT